jgi:hypothetical protein
MQLQWDKTATRGLHPVLGYRYKQWRSTDGGYRVTINEINSLRPFYRPEAIDANGDGRARWVRVDSNNHTTLADAQAACQRHADREAESEVAK